MNEIYEEILEEEEVVIEDAPEAIPEEESVSCIGGECYCKHYIRTDDDGVILEGWSTGPNYDHPTDDAICINEKGGYQFRLFPDGEENPSLVCFAGIPCYKYIDGEIVERDEDEIQAIIDRMNEEEMTRVTPEEQLRADVDFLAALQGVTL